MPVAIRYLIGRHLVDVSTEQSTDSCHYDSTQMTNDSVQNITLIPSPFPVSVIIGLIEAATSSFLVGGYHEYSDIL